MRKDTNKDLDLLFKEGLADAGVKAPRGAWKAVSARLDEAAGIAPAPKGAWLRWGAPAFAFAAAALAAVLIIGNTEKTIIESGDSIITSIETQHGPMAQAVENEPTTVQSESATPAKSVRASFVPKEVQTPEQIEVLPSEPTAEPTQNTAAVETPQTEQAEPVQQEAQPAQHDQIQQPEAESTLNNEPETWTDPFAAMEAEDAAIAARKANRTTALKVGGTIGGNDAHFNNGPTKPSFSSGLYSSGAVNEESVSVYGIPLSFGLSGRYHFTDKIAVSAGVNWSYLTRSFSGSYKTAEGEFTHNMQYIGIPISVSYDVVNSKTLMFYGYAGASAEKAISSKYYIYADSASPLYSESVKSLQYGIFAGLGVEFKLTNLLGLYVDPCVRYYFPGDQPKSIRTDKPLMFSFEAGLRINL